MKENNDGLKIELTPGENKNKALEALLAANNPDARRMARALATDWPEKQMDWIVSELRNDQKVADTLITTINLVTSTFASILSQGCNVENDEDINEIAENFGKAFGFHLKKILTHSVNHKKAIDEKNSFPEKDIQ